jgi:undecaprenyl diphosphate synthase
MTEKSEVPKCIGIIMDGNRRWAKSQGLPSFEGHRRGYQKLKEVTDWSIGAGVNTLVFFAFSEENWKRSQEEVSFMMTLIREILKDQIKEASEKNIKLRFVGNISKFDRDIVDGMKEAEKETENNTGLNVAIAVSYGGRQEIVNMVNEAIKSGKENVTKEDVDGLMYTAGLPDPDIIIRTSGEMRLSGFLPWQAVYSELFFTKTFWPDFSKEEFEGILEQYANRERRMGK